MLTQGGVDDQTFSRGEGCMRMCMCVCISVKNVRGRGTEVFPFPLPRMGCPRLAFRLRKDPRDGQCVSSVALSLGTFVVHSFLS